MRFAIPRQTRRRRQSVDHAPARRQRGQAAEERLFRVVAADNHRHPAWVVSVNRATSEQDRAGVDIVIEVDCGRVYVNIKNSPDAVQYFKTNENRRFIPCLLVDSYATDAEVYERFLALVAAEREKILSRRILQPA